MMAEGVGEAVAVDSGVAVAVAGAAVSVAAGAAVTVGGASVGAGAVSVAGAAVGRTTVGVVRGPQAARARRRRVGRRRRLSIGMGQAD
jgi:hypothetical protein